MEKSKKILIIGSCGAGKSTLAKKISAEMGLSLIGLDQFYWKPGWVRSSRDDWRNIVSQLVQGDKWAMEGNYQGTFDIRFPVCDTVIVFDINRFICMLRIIKRKILKNRIDEITGCSQKIKWDLIKWVLWDYPRRGRKNIFNFINQYRDKKIVFIKSNKDLKNIINKLV